MTLEFRLKPFLHIKEHRVGDGTDRVSNPS